MKTYTISQDENIEFNVSFADSLTAGYGHKTIIVNVNYNGSYKIFTSKTSDMKSYDEAMELDGQEKYEAFFELIQDNIDYEIEEWIEQLNN